MRMTKRLQFLLGDSEYREIKRMARSRQMSIAKWARQALGLTCQSEPSIDAEKKLEAIRRAVRYNFPSGDIEGMLGEVEAGHSGSQDPESRSGDR